MRRTHGGVVAVVATALLAGSAIGASPASADTDTMSAVVKDIPKYDAPKAIDLKKATYTYSMTSGTISSVVKVRDLKGKGTLRVSAVMRNAKGTVSNDRLTITKRSCKVESDGVGPVPCDVLADVTWLPRTNQIVVVDHGWEGGDADNRFVEVKMAVSMTRGDRKDSIPGKYLSTTPRRAGDRP